MTKSPRGKPLSGVRILVGRARRQASALSAGLKALGAEVIEIPFIEIRSPKTYKPLDSALKRIQEYEWLILTSVNGAEALGQRLKHLQIKPHTLAHLRIVAIGPATRDAITRLGLKVAVVPDRYIAESLVERLRDKVDGKRVLLARAKIARDVIPRELRVVMNDPNRRPHVITFTSSSTVRNFAALLGGRGRPPHTNIKFASIGPVTSGTLRELDFPVDIETKEYTIPGLVKAILAAGS